MFVNKTESVERLRSLVAGDVLTPDDPQYEQTRRGWDLTIDHHPALILIPKDTQDVVAGVRFARDEGLGVAMQLTGHGIQQPADDALLIVPSQMNEVRINAELRSAHVEAGVMWGQVVKAAAKEGLAPLVGTFPYLGVVGYTLGGGIGWLARKYGFAADNVRSIDIVTPDGVLRHTSPTEHSDLFWGLRGGGGNFGVVVAMAFDLFPVATIYGGGLTYPGEVAGEALRYFRDWVQTVPDDLTSSFVIMKYPPLPQLPKAVRGKTQVIIRAVFAGNAAEGEALIRPWLNWRAPISSTFHEMPFGKISTVSSEPVDPHAVRMYSEMFNELSDDAIDIIARYATGSASPLARIEIRHAGGAMARAPKPLNAIGNREAQFYLMFSGMVPTPELQAAVPHYAQQFTAELQPYLQGGFWLNFMSGSEARKRIRDAYLPESYQRLLALKTKYDSDNQFRFSYQLSK